MWLNIDGFDGRYQISDAGKVRSVSPIKGVRELKIRTAENGWCYVQLYKNGKQKTYMLHKLLADTYKISISSAKQIIYESYRGNLVAKNNIRLWILEKLEEYEKDQETYHDEILYLKKFLSMV